MASKVQIVIPNHLETLDFLKEWPQLKQYDIIVVQDIGEKPEIPSGFNITIYDHEDIRADLKDNAWIIPERTSACRSYGYYKAWQRKPEYIVTLDNDCFPEDPNYYIPGHIAALNTPATLDWVNTANDDLMMRGFPYLNRNKSQTWLNHGLWSNVPDLDGATWLHNPDLRFNRAIGSRVIPRHNFFPMCGMNLAWRAELTPAMYFGIFGPEYGFDQYDDIWAGVLVKKILDHLGHAVRSGYPSVEHRKQSNVFVNLQKQAPGMAMNESFWRVVQDIRLFDTTVAGCYAELIRKLPDVVEGEPEGWTKKFKRAALLWADLYKES
jgi:hypothetical protein